VYEHAVNAIETMLDEVGCPKQECNPDAQNAMNKTDKQLDRIAQLLREQTTLSLASTDEDGLPCVAPLFYIVDEGLNLYWLSSESSQHSRNLRQRPQVAATVYCAVESWRQIRGVQMRGAVSVVAEPRLRAAITERYVARFKLGRVLKLAVRQSILHVLQPEFFRFLDNSRGFRSKIELIRPPQGWLSTCR
jgi:uncharacterized protein YhbP (UPF0306 family)